MPHHSGAELPGAQALRQMAAQSDSRGLFSDRAPDPAYAGLFLNRELSWLQFNRRVLAEAADETLPGYERLKFLSIYCSNLDEFYMVRVGGLLDRALLQPWHTEAITGLTPREQLRAIYDETARQQKDFKALWRKVTAALAKQHVEILDFDRLDEADEVLLRRRFDALRPLLSPQVLDAEHPLPFLRNREQYVLVRFAGKRGGAGLVPTTQLPKFFKLTVDGVQKLALTAPLVAHFAPLLFGERHVRETAIVRVTRSADISVRDIMDGCDADLRAVMERLLRRRRRLEPVRAQVQGRVSDEIRALARELLGLPKRQLFVTSAPTDLSFVLTMPGEFDLTGLTCPEIPPAKNVALQKGDYFAYLAQHDLLLALPYQSINPFVDLLYEAADDPDVVSIKITLYRLAGSSRIAAALAYAAEHGKQVQCLLELRARFDEQSNIDYSRMLEDAGCDILYGLTKYKVHTKLCLITRRCPGGICYYTQVGTGNYNEKTAEQYTDLMLLTSDPAIGRDAAKTFDRLRRRDGGALARAGGLQAAADGAHRGADAPRPGGIHRHQGQLHERRGRHGAARARERGGHGGGAVRARHLLPAAGRARADGTPLGAQHHRAVSGARAYFRLWPRGGTGGVHRLGRPARAQHHAPDRGFYRRDRPQRACGGARGAQRHAARQPAGVDHAAGRQLPPPRGRGRAVCQSGVSAHVLCRAHRRKARAPCPAPATKKAAVVAAAVDLAEK